MKHSINPFTRGYHDFDIQRVAVIGYDDRCPMTYLPCRCMVHKAMCRTNS